MTYQRTIAKLKKRLPLEKLIGEYIQLEKYTTIICGPCPFHKDNARDLTIDIADQTWRCYTCNFREKDIIDFIMLKNDVNYSRAVQCLGNKVKLDVEPILAHKRKAIILNSVSGIFSFPFLFAMEFSMFLFLPLIAGVGFLITDWENEREVKFYKDLIASIIKFKSLSI